MRIHELTLTAKNLESLAQFYQEILEVQTQIIYEDLIEISIGTSKLKFLKSNGDHIYHFAFNIPPFTIDAYYNYFKTKIEIIPYQGDDIVAFEDWNAKAFYFHDSSGNIVEIIDRRELPFDYMNNLDLNKIQFLEISEIGLPVANVSDSYQKLSKETQIKAYQKGDDEFMALGTVQGLFILVPHAVKSWLPTQIPAKKAPLSTICEIEGKVYQINSTDHLTVKPVKKQG